MSVLSVDLACGRYRDIGCVMLRDTAAGVLGEVIELEASDPPSPHAVAALLDQCCRERQIRMILLDGPQAWKSHDNGLDHSRVCERSCNTPAKSGLPGVAKPRTWLKFVEFSICVFDELGKHGWQRLRDAADPGDRILVETFPFSAWRALGLPSLPAKRKAKMSDLERCFRALTDLVPIKIEGSLSHDQLQAVIAGLAGVALENRDPAGYMVTGLPPEIRDGHWREGFIVNPKRAAKAQFKNMVR